jgi:hypothetical protein
MLLKKSATDAVHATIESRRPAIRIKIATSTGFLNQSCAAAPSKSFFNTIGHERPTCRSLGCGSLTPTSGRAKENRGQPNWAGSCHRPHLRTGFKAA